MLQRGVVESGPFRAAYAPGRGLRGPERAALAPEHESLSRDEMVQASLL